MRKLMKDKVSKLQGDVEQLRDKVESHDSEISLLRKFKHDTNGHLQQHNGKFQVIETNQKSVVEELMLIRSDIREWMGKTNNLLNWQLSIKFMLVGGAAVGTVMVGGAVFLLRTYVEYFH